MSQPPDDNDADTGDETEAKAKAEAGDAEPQWRFGVDEVGEDAPEPDTIEPETPVLENVVFVLLGIALSAFVFYTAVGSL
ncbi:DUF7312 domain-containing protein [Haloplanus sp.]|uniref:DUF7312 domain-containing protein n=1 Tax=Haloplanus sp. TaxID=1961696 RepID=UPI0026112ED1|nr:hypothetical protein [Haloplanus sp.]